MTDPDAFAPTASFMTANFVAREAGWSIPDWGAGDRATNEAFSPIETFRERFAALIDEAVNLGFDAIDLWEGHLNARWATPEHVSAAVSVLRDRGVTVTSLAGWFGNDAERVAAVCRLAVAVSAPILGGGTKLLEDDRDALVRLLEEHDLRFGLENHPEKTPGDVRARIGEDAGGRIGATVDTGWFGTQGYDAAAAILELGDRVLHVHLKDVRHAGVPHETCGYGEGVVPLERCVDALRDIGYRGGISVEHEPESYDPRDEIRAARKALAGWLGR
ncbi:MAG TPA: sugar phosphate isomerase/epimerase [Candidatus Limnocylindria bacterium]|nr:sugar phosphate isomerase/epimerase [Candidatus Limnocylindria bacterium]